MSSYWFDAYYAGLQNLDGEPAFQQWCAALPEFIEQVYAKSNHGDLARWQAQLAALPAVSPSARRYDSAAVTVECNVDNRRLREQLRSFKPWRKGPFDIGGVFIDSEWRSDLKWDRLRDAIAPLSGRLVLDVGCGNGYHCWRVAGAGARAVIGIDPMFLYLMQYYAVQHFMRADNVFVLPMVLEQMPPALQCFDTVFSMGVLYHRRSPLDHLSDLHACLRPGGELVLETLVIEGDADRVLVPGDRYACMKNVWFIPSCAQLVIWLQRCGFHSVRIIDEAATTPAEQRVTEWTGDASLQQFLDPTDAGKTVEGLPAPRRAVLLASA